MLFFFSKNWTFQSFKLQDARLFQLGISIYFLGALKIIARQCQLRALVFCTRKLASTCSTKINVDFSLTFQSSLLVVMYFILFLKEEMPVCPRT